VKEARVDKGPFLKRVQPNSRGRADLKKIRTSHIRIVVSDEPPPPKEKRQRAKAVALDESVSTTEQKEDAEQKAAG
jgi:large subunit ribosomal protein L22